MMNFLCFMYATGLADFWELYLESLEEVLAGCEPISKLLLFLLIFVLVFALWGFVWNYFIIRELSKKNAILKDIECDLSGIARSLAQRPDSNSGVVGTKETK